MQNAYYITHVRIVSYEITMLYGIYGSMVSSMVKKCMKVVNPLDGAAAAGAIFDNLQCHDVSL